MEIVLLWILVPTVIVALLARNRGRSLHWAWWSVFLGWIGAVIAIIALVSKDRIEPELAHAPTTLSPKRRQPDLRRRPRSLPAGGRVEVVGESYRQTALWNIVGNRKPVDDRRHLIDAVLIPEADNPYDAWAVGVFVGGKHVGYLPKETAAKWQPKLNESGGTCRGWIVGGFETNDGELASLGVLLELQESPD